MPKQDGEGVFKSTSEWSLKETTIASVVEAQSGEWGTGPWTSEAFKGLLSCMRF